TLKTDNQVAHANDEEEVTATMLHDMMQSLKANICNTIESAVKGLQAEVAAVKSELSTTAGAIQQSINLQEERLAAVEDSATKASDAIADMEVTVSALKNEILALQNKCEDLENRLRRNNLRIVSIAEGEEGKAPTEFISSLLEDLLNLDEKPLLDQAHRLALPKPKQGQAPRPFILRVHFFHVKEQILRLAQEKRRLLHKDKPVHIFTDFTAAEAKRRAAFNEARRALQNISGARFGFRHPATFRITLPGGTEYRFTDPQKPLFFAFFKFVTSLGISPQRFQIIPHAPPMIIYLINLHHLRALYQPYIAN
uniref:L1 transposable element RRM domain-containing protein n=1 Tax=Sander lucioperca TaxID=283035 RepID=A0A8C9XNH6_SANLU